MGKRILLFLSMALANHVSHAMGVPLLGVDEMRLLHNSQRKGAWEQLKREQKHDELRECEDALVALNRQELEDDWQLSANTDLIIELSLDRSLSRYARLFMISEALKKRAQVHSKNNVLAQFPLIVECRSEVDPGVVALLLAKGADARQIDDFKKTAFDYAQDCFESVDKKIDALEERSKIELEAKKVENQASIRISLRWARLRKADIVQTLSLLRQAQVKPRDNGAGRNSMPNQ